MDLNAPLGTTSTPRRKRGGSVGLRLGVGLGAAAIAAGGIGYGILTANPRGGEPYAVATIARTPPKPVVPPVSPPDPMPTGSIASRAPDRPIEGDAGAEAATVENGVRVFRGILPGGTAPQVAAGNGAAGNGPLVIDVSKALNGAKALDGAKVPSGAQVLKGEGKTDAARTSATVAHPVAARPRVAILVGGMGLGPGATRTAIDTMPAAVTLAFVATGEGLAATVDAARAKGHEVLIQLPMESVAASGQAARSLGPHSLTSTESPAALNADLDWLLARFKGYDGVTNLLGAAVTETPATMTGVLKAVGARGLFYVDDGTSRRSLAASLAPGLGVSAMRADIVLDATADPAAVGANLDALVALARRKGAAIGMASGLPDHLATIARYADGLARQGVDLVPVGTLVRGTNDVTAAR